MLSSTVPKLRKAVGLNCRNELKPSSLGDLEIASLRSQSRIVTMKLLVSIEMYKLESRWLQEGIIIKEHDSSHCHFISQQQRDPDLTLHESR